MTEHGLIKTIPVLGGKIVSGKRRPTCLHRKQPDGTSKQLFFISAKRAFNGMHYTPETAVLIAQAMRHCRKKD